MKITIAIPTFNRNDILKNNLKKFLPQLNYDCRLLILDNNSKIPVKETLHQLIKKFPNLKIDIIRNRYNIGMTANICRCFELCDDSWLWILGDDDEVKEGAVLKVINDIKRHNDAHIINYAWDADTFKRKKEVVTLGANQFIDQFETFGAVLFLSTSVYNIKKVINGISYAHFFQSSYAPHLVMLLMSLGDYGKSIYSNNQIVINNGENTPNHLKWDQIFIYQINIILRLPLKPIAIAKLKKRLEQLTRVWTIYHFIYVLVFSETEKGSTKNKPLVLYNEIVRGFFSLDRRFSTRIVSLFGYFIIKYPFLFKNIFSKVYKLYKGKDFHSQYNSRI